MRGYRLELKLNKHQRILCVKSAGTARFAYYNNIAKNFKRSEVEIR